MLVPSLSFAADAVALVDGASVNVNHNAVSLSPNVGLSYHSATGNNYALTGASSKGVMCYGVESGNQGVFQMKVAVNDNIGGNVTTATDDDDPSLDGYTGVGTWVQVGG